MPATRGGPLAGLKVIELAGLAPAPFGCMLLADLGADVVRIDRAVAGPDGPMLPESPVHTDVLGRGRRSVALDLKSPTAIELALALVERADVLVEGFRPGVMERLGLGPEACHLRNPGLVYGRMTGWGQEGPLAQTAGHDINYIAVSGALHLIGDEHRPIPPANLVGDFAGGGLLLAFGVLAALHERQSSGLGQVVDAAMVDGSSSFTTMLHGLRSIGEWTDERGRNLMDGAAPYYNTYETADGGHVAVGAMEPQFYRQLVLALDLPGDLDGQDDEAAWPARRERFAAAFRARPRDEWAEVLGTTDACVQPVLTLGEVADHPHNVSRQSFVELDGVVQPAPAPRFARTPAATPMAASGNAARGGEALVDWGVPTALVEAALAHGALLLGHGAPEPTPA